MRMPATGDVLNERYRVESPLGEGAFGVVVQGFDLVASRRVAIKILKTTANGYDNTIEARFLREMRAIATLQSPYTVKLFDFGRTHNGLLFMVCEYVGGEDLVDMVERRERLPEREVLHILQQALMSLAEAHSHGVLHRDIKPHNIRVFRYEDDPLRIKVLDFGLARPIQDDANLTGTGQVVGTLRYMSPEQLYDGVLTPASDIYSLGIVGVEMVLGRDATKFDDYRVFSTGEFAGIGLSTRVVLQRMTELDPSQRYATAAEALRDIRLALDGVELHREEPRLTPHPPVDLSAPATPVERPPTRAKATGPEGTRAKATGPEGTRAKTTGLPVQSPPKPARLHRWLGALGVVGCVIVVVAIALSSGEPEPPPPQPAAPRASVETLLGQQAPPLVPIAEEPEEPESTGSPGCGSDPGPRGLRTMKRIEGLDSVSWLLYLPDNYDPNTRHPVAVMFHNDGQDGKSFLLRTQFQKIADEKGIVVILPESGLLAWRNYSTVDGIAQSVEQAASIACIDRDRVFAIGHSIGAAGADYLACSGLPLAGIVANSYRPANTNPTCSGLPLVPTLLVNPLDSHRIPPDGRVSCSTAHTHLTIEAYEQLYIERNLCSGERKKTFEHPSGTCWSWDCEVPLTSCNVSGGVGWAGSGVPEFDPLGCDPPGVSDFPTDQAIWQFMESVAPAKEQPETDRGQ